MQSQTYTSMPKKKKKAKQVNKSREQSMVGVSVLTDTQSTINDSVTDINQLVSGASTLIRPVITVVTSSSSMCTKAQVVTTTATGVTNGCVRPSTQTLMPHVKEGIIGTIFPRGCVLVAVKHSAHQWPAAWQVGQLRLVRPVWCSIQWYKQGIHKLELKEALRECRHMIICIPRSVSSSGPWQQISSLSVYLGVVAWGHKQDLSNQSQAGCNHSVVINKVGIKHQCRQTMKM